MKCSHSGKPLQVPTSQRSISSAGFILTKLKRKYRVRGLSGQEVLPIVPLGADVGADPEVHVEAGVGGGLDEPHQVIPALEVVLLQFLPVRVMTY
jgi:hypothetical protein